MKCNKCSCEYDGIRCPVCGEYAIPVVVNSKTEYERKNRKMEIFLIVAAVIVVIAIIVAVAVTKNKKADVSVNESASEETTGFLPEAQGKDTTPVTFTEDVSISFEGIDGAYADDLLEHATMASTTVAFRPETTTQASRPAAAQTTKPVKPQVSTTKHFEETTTVSDNPADGSDEVMKVLAAFFAGKYYMDGTMISGGEKTPLEVAMDGNSFQIYSEMDGKDIAIMNKDGDIYLMNPDTKKYTELNAAVKKMMGLETTDFSFSFSKVKFDAASPASVKKATYNGKSAVCYKYKNSENEMDFIAVDNKIVQMVLYDSQHKPDTIVDFDEFTAGYPEDMLTFKGYSKTNMISFISSLM
ncbi:MAG: hypothetical protein IKW03_06515 [Clostridia bacterium]|nr:hypothetical protein [Clostridia bacterium]